MILMKTLNTFLSHLSTFMGIALVAIFPLVATLVLVGLMTLSSPPVEPQNDPLALWRSFGIVPKVGFILLFLASVAGFASLWVSPVLAVSEIHRTGQTSIRQTFGKLCARHFRLFGLAFAGAIPMVGPFIVLLCVVATPVAALENLKAFPAIKRSVIAYRGAYIRALAGVILFSSLGVIFLALLGSLVPGGTWLRVFAMLGGFLILFVFLQLQMIYLTLIYYDQKAREEASAALP